jgi:hypothetical protein
MNEIACYRCVLEDEKPAGPLMMVAGTVVCAGHYHEDQRTIKAARAASARAKDIMQQIEESRRW